ncbi:MAG TPA: hypothetical protein VFP17_10930 [Solirubrobacterales bacterium]|nr:hypothetical protein [Solirubrobacterales bacterium]
MAVVVGIFLARSDGSGIDAKAEAAAICTHAQHEVELLPRSPGSISQGLEIERGLVEIHGRELARLRQLAPRLGDPFQDGVVADQRLFAGLSTMIARPDFVKLSLTLPGHPNLAPDWLKRWLAREQGLQALASSKFSQAGIPACEKSLG